MTVRSGLVAVVSPTGGVHACRPGQTRTACGTDTTRRRFRGAQNGRYRWVAARSTYEELVAKGTPGMCRSCAACLAEGMGPGA